jgi:hypothetical protein
MPARTRRARDEGTAESPTSTATSPRHQDTAEPMPTATGGTSEDTAAGSRNDPADEAAPVPPQQPPSPTSARQLRLERLALKLRTYLLDDTRSDRDCLR